MNNNKNNRMNKNEEVTLVRKKEDFRSRGIKSGSVNNFGVTEVLRNIFMEMNKTEKSIAKRMDKSICRRRKQQKVIK